MKTIWKYTLLITDFQEIETPSYTRFLHVAEQYGSLTLWAEVDTNTPIEKRTIAIVGTGHEVSARCISPIGSVLTARGELVWHVYTAYNQ